VTVTKFKFWSFVEKKIMPVDSLNCLGKSFLQCHVLTSLPLHFQLPALQFVLIVLCLLSADSILFIIAGQDHAPGRTTQQFGAGNFTHCSG
jgi:hypothetical protein